MTIDSATRNEILSLARRAHDLTEAAYRELPATRGQPGWDEKQRVLLADMAIHLLQTALRDGVLPEERLKTNLFSILTICDQLLPGRALKQVAESLYSGPGCDTD